MYKSGKAKDPDLVKLEERKQAEERRQAGDGFVS